MTSGGAAEPRPESAVLLVHPGLPARRRADVHSGFLAAAQRAGWSVHTAHPRSAAQTEQAAAAVGPATVVVAVGGDGLVARAGAGVLRSGAVLAPIPAGRGNDYARALGVPADPLVALRRLPLLPVRRVDVGRVDGRPFLGVACAGVDATANELANAAPRWLGGSLVYAWSGLRAILRDPPRRYRIDLPGGAASAPAWTVVVGCTHSYGGGLRVCPGARPDDGVLHVVVIGPVSRLRFAGVLSRMRRGTHLGLSQVSGDTTTQLRLSADRPTAVFADGDRIGALPATFAVEPGALRVLA